MERVEFNVRLALRRRPPAAAALTPPTPRPRSDFDVSGNSLSGSIPDEIAGIDFEAGSGNGECTLTDASPTNAFTCPLPDVAAKSQKSERT